MRISQTTRNVMRNVFNQNNSEVFPRYGKVGIDIYAVLRLAFSTSEDMLSRKYVCRSCLYESEAESLDTVLWHCNKKIWKNSPFALGGYKDRNLTEWLQPLLVTQSDQKCPHCQRVLILRTSYDVEPEFLCIMH